MAQSIASTQHRPRALLRYTPPDTTYQLLQYASGDLPDWVHAVEITCAIEVRVAHWVADGATLASVSEYELVPAGDTARIAVRDGLNILISGAATNDVEVVAVAI